MNDSMYSDDHRISPLDVRSRAKLVASVRISSLNEVVVELIKNAVDAHARDIEVTLNYSTGFCSVADDGCGIPASEFSESGRLAQQYCTSKATSKKQIYGRYGQTLSQIAGVGLLCIISKASQHARTHVLWCDEAGRIDNDTRGSEDIRACVGTTVKVYNLFSKMPVRSRYISQLFANHHEVQREFSRLKQLVLGLVLSSVTPFEVDVKYSSAELRYHHRPTAVRSLIQELRPYQSPEAVNSALRQAGFMREQRDSAWCQVHVQSESLEGYAIISTVPLPHRDLQFISINNKALSRDLRPEVFTHINSLFNASAFGSLEPNFDSKVGIAEFASSPDCEHRGKQRKRLKSIDQWPMFVIWLEDNHSLSLCDLLYGRLLTGIVESLLDRVIRFTELIVSEFLLQNGFPSILKMSRKPRLGSSATRKSLNSNSDSLEEITKRNFDYFSRLKSSAQTANTEVLDGLPFSNNSGGSPFKSIAHLQVSSSRTDATDSTDSSPSPLPWNENEEQVMLWPDTNTGRYLRVDLRTGMLLPDDIPERGESQRSVPATLSQRHPMTLPNKRMNDSNMTQTVRNIHKHFDKTSRSQNAPIRSAMIPDHDTYDFRSPYKQSLTQNEESVHSLCKNERPTRIAREALMNVKFVTQVDKKFILAVIPVSGRGLNEHEFGDDLLILIDQHAADERCKVESLLKSVQLGDSVRLKKSIHCELPTTEFARLLQIKPALDRLCFFIEVSSKASRGVAEDDQLRQIEIKALPEAIAERCRLNPRLAIDILREAIWSEHAIGIPPHGEININAKAISPVSIAQGLPSRMLDLISSRACRSAIMFNDSLDNNQCLDLVLELSRCTLPFQCAHGRPSMTVVADMHYITNRYPSGLVTSPRDMYRASATDSSQLFPWLTEVHDLSGLNSIDFDDTPNFGDAYRSWLRNDLY